VQVCIYGRVWIRREREAFDENLALFIGVNVMWRVGESETFLGKILICTSWLE